MHTKIHVCRRTCMHVCTCTHAQKHTITGSINIYNMYLVMPIKYYNLFNHDSALMILWTINIIISGMSIYFATT